MTMEFVRDKNDWDFGTMSFECDECGETFESEGDFSDCIQAAKDDGWIIFLADDDTWTHLCSKECHAAITFD